MYCPEANTLDLNVEKMIAEVIINRCKGCELCMVVCDAAKHEAITMVAVKADGTLMESAGEAAELGQAYQG
jgi:pyruvate ferredoxin oxidoreductase delta subunit